MNARASAPAVATTCPYCGVGCGIVATPEGEGDVAIAGDASHPANAGRLCVKGAALGETLGTEARLLYPAIHGLRTTWPRALNAVAGGFAKALFTHGPQSIAMYLSGQLLTEDYYVANKLMKGFLGSANVDTNSRLCMASAVAGHRRAFGADVVPGCYEDFDEPKPAQPKTGFVLNTGRVRDHWHTMTRTGLSPRLARHSEAPFVEVHPDDAKGWGLTDGGFALVTTAHG